MGPQKTTFKHFKGKSTSLVNKLEIDEKIKKSTENQKSLDETFFKFS